MATTRTERIAATDGAGTFGGALTLPGAGSGPGVLVIHEIFGVNDYIADAARRLADLGYVAMAPDLFWRQEPGVALPSEESSLPRGMALAGGFDGDKGALDLGAALAHLRSLPEVTGGVGVLGFCFGGTMAYLTAALHQPDAAVSYYGSGVPDMVGMAGQITCPILFHFGSADPYLPLEAARQVEQAFAGRPGAEVYFHEGAGHAFDNSFSAMFSQPEPAAAAWAQTSSFLQRHLPAPAS